MTDESACNCYRPWSGGRYPIKGPCPVHSTEDPTVETVARALWHDHAMRYADVPIEDWARVEESYREGYLREARVAIAAMPKSSRYWVGYYCPRGSGHYEIYGQPEYTPECGSKGWNVYLDAEEGDEYLPEGEWR